MFEGLVFAKTHHARVVERGHATINFAVTSGAAYMIRHPLDLAISLSHHLGLTIDDAITTMATCVFETGIDDSVVYEVWGCGASTC